MMREGRLRARRNFGARAGDSFQWFAAQSAHQAPARGLAVSEGRIQFDIAITVLRARAARPRITDDHDRGCHSAGWLVFTNPPLYRARRFSGHE